VVPSIRRRSTYVFPVVFLCSLYGGMLTVLLNVPTHFRISSRKCRPSKPGHDDLHLLLYIPFHLLMYHY